MGGDRIADAIERIANVIESQHEEERRRRNAARDRLARDRQKSALCGRLCAAMDAAIEGAGGLPHEFDAERAYRAMRAAKESDELVELLRRSLDLMKSLAEEYRACDPAMSERVMGAAYRAAVECLERTEGDSAGRDIATLMPHATRRRAPKVLSQVNECLDALFEAEDLVFQKLCSVLEVGGVFSAFPIEPTWSVRPDLPALIAELERAASLPFSGPLDNPVPIAEAFWYGWSGLAWAVGFLCPLPRGVYEAYQQRACKRLVAALSE